MRTYNAKVVENKTLNLTKFNPTSVSDSSGTLTMTFSSSDATVLKVDFLILLLLVLWIIKYF